MRLSLTERLIIFHIPRTAGGSVIWALDDELFVRVAPSPWSKLWSKALPFVRRPPERAFLRTHETAARVQRLLGPDIFAQFRKIAYVRNPYSWLVSFYESLRRSKGHRHQRIVSSLPSFGDYVDWEIARGKRFLHPYVMDRDERLLIDYLGRYERLAQDHAEICELLGIETQALPHLGQRVSKDYREYYDAATKRKVAGAWARDLELFGYDFDGLVRDDFPLRTDHAPAS